MYVFAKNALDLNDDTILESNKAYKKQPDSNFIDNGFNSNEIVLSEKLNYYLLKLTEFLEKCENKGIVEDSFFNDIIEDDAAEEGDIRGNFVKKGDSWIPINQLATYSTNGWITDALVKQDWFSSIPHSSRTIAGSIKKNDYKDSLLSEFNIEYIHPSGESWDNNDWGQTWYSKEITKIHFSPQTEGSEFFIKKILKFNTETEIDVNGNSLKNNEIEDMYILYDGTIC